MQNQNQKYASYLANKIPTTMYDTPKNSEKWVESKYKEIERLGIMPGAWSAKGLDDGISNIFVWDILYTIRFVKWGESNGAISIM